MKRLIALGLALTLSHTAVADEGYAREVMEQRQKEQAFMRQLCGDSYKTGFSPLLGGPENYEYHFPTMGKFASEVHSVKAFKSVVTGPVDEILKKAAANRKQAIISRDHTRRLYDFSEDRFNEGGFGGVTSEALRQNEQSMKENLAYMTKKALDDSADHMKSFEIWVPKARAGMGGSRMGEVVRRNILSNTGRVPEDHYAITPYSLLQQCRSIWSRVTY